MPFELPTTVDPDVFVARTRRKVKGITYGWDSGRMDEVVAALRAYKANGGSRERLKNALIHWRNQKRGEFDNRDRVSGGLGFLRSNRRRRPPQFGLPAVRPLRRRT